MTKHSTQRGFSLVELSIVLVILGLLTGGILGGQSLIRAAELRAVMTEYTQFQTAINSFKSKYNALPGDMPNAVQFWGRADNGSFTGECASPATNTGSGTQTCNGNGNGQVNGGGSHERYRFWQHLANAGLINGQYTGIAGSGSNQHHIPGENSPTSRVGNLGWSLENDGADTLGNGSTSLFWYQRGEMHHVIGLGTATTTNDTIHGFLAFTPEEAWSINTKSDDGKPGTGRIHSAYYSSNTCTTGADTSDYEAAEYNLSNSAKTCTITFPDAL